MAKVSLAEHMKERRTSQPEDLADSGPYVTISRQYGCQGFSLGLLLLDILNEEALGASWQVYHKEILSALATETNLGAEFLERQRRSKPSMIVDFLRSLKRERTPSGYEVRNRITAIIRTLAIEGHAIIIGQGGAGATQDIPNGLSVRLEAPEDWRVKQVAFSDGLGEAEARQMIRDREREREYLRKLYETRYPRRPAFNIIYDCSAFSLAHIAQHIVQMMKHMKCV
jgi:cytidylate kinase